MDGYETNTADDFLWMWVLIAVVIFGVLYMYYQQAALPPPFAPPSVASSGAPPPSTPFSGAPPPSAASSASAASGPSVKEKIMHGLALVAVRGALYKYCPHLSSTQHDLVVSTLVKWKERGYRQPSILVPLLWLCVRNGRQSRDDDRVLQELTSVLRVFCQGPRHSKYDDADEEEDLSTHLPPPPVYTSATKEADEAFCKEYALDASLVSQVPLHYRSCLEETLRSGKCSTCPITLEDLQDPATHRVLSTTRVSVLFRTTAGKHYGQLFSTQALEHWFSSGRMTDPMTGAATSDSCYYRVN